MSWDRLIVAALFICSLPAFAQDQFLVAQKSSNSQQAPDLRTPPAATSSEPWRILPKADSNKDSIAITPQTEARDSLRDLGWPTPADTMCFAIRSYVVARDSKDSDSVHPVGYTTCVPAAKARLKTADEHVVLVR